MTAKAEHGTELYLDLVRRFPLRPIRSDEELDRAIAVVDDLTDRDDRDEAEGDYLFVLGDLIRRYEKAAHPIPPAEDADLLRLLMGWRGITQSDLAAATEIPVSTISEVLSGKRRVSRRNIGVLARYFDVSPAVFSF